MFRVIVGNIKSDGTIGLINDDENRLLTALSLDDALRLKGELSDAVFNWHKIQTKLEVDKRKAKSANE